MTTTEARITRREPILGQLDLRCIREAAVRILHLRGAAAYLRRDLSRSELQLLAACGAIVGIVVGELGEDLNGDSVGDLVLREYPRQLRLVGDNGR